MDIIGNSNSKTDNNNDKYNHKNKGKITENRRGSKKRKPQMVKRTFGFSK